MWRSTKKTEETSNSLFGRLKNAFARRFCFYCFLCFQNDFAITCLAVMNFIIFIGDKKPLYVLQGIEATQKQKKMPQQNMIISSTII